VVFLTPTSGLVAFAVILPLAAFVVAERRAARVRRALNLRDRPLVARLPVVLAILAFAALLGAATAQPVVERSRYHYARKDAAAFFVIDTSRSMLAREGPKASDRFDRARAAALRLRFAIPDVRVGLASITDRVLPHLFPTIDLDAFVATLDRSISVDRPPPSSLSELRSTDYGALSGLANQNFFPVQTRHRLVVVLTDGETIPVTATYLRDLYDIAPRMRVIFVRFWSETERVYGSNGRPEPQYRPDPSSGAQLARIATTMGDKFFNERRLGDAISVDDRQAADGARSLRRPRRVHPARVPPLAPEPLTRRVSRR
jgi:hypothetical protein